MKRTILVVDDSPFVYHQVKDMVEESDYQVIGSAKSGEEGIQLFRELKPDVLFWILLCRELMVWRLQKLLCKKKQMQKLLC